MSPLPVGSTVPVVGCVVGTGPVGSSEGTEVSGETPLEPGVLGVGSGATVVGAVVAFGSTVAVVPGGGGGATPVDGTVSAGSCVPSVSWDGSPEQATSELQATSHAPSDVKRIGVRRRANWGIGRWWQFV